MYDCMFTEWDFFVLCQSHRPRLCGTDDLEPPIFGPGAHPVSLQWFNTSLPIYAFYVPECISLCHRNKNPPLSGLCNFPPRLDWGSLRRFPGPLVCWGGGIGQAPYPTHFGACGPLLISPLLLKVDGVLNIFPASRRLWSVCSYPVILYFLQVDAYGQCVLILWFSSTALVLLVWMTSHCAVAPLSKQKCL